MKLLSPGDRVQDFTAVDQDGNPIKLSDFKGGKLVIFFYPRANTEGCTREVCNLRDHYGDLRRQGYALLGVSGDSQRKQRNFKRKHGLPFPLIADTQHDLIRLFGVWGPKTFMGRAYDGIHRTTFVLDEAGVVERVIDKVVTADHAAQILRGIHPGPAG